MDAGFVDVEIMASIETVVQNNDGDADGEAKPDSTAEVKDEPGKLRMK